VVLPETSRSNDQHHYPVWSQLQIIERIISSDVAESPEIDPTVNGHRTVEKPASTTGPHMEAWRCCIRRSIITRPGQATLIPPILWQTSRSAIFQSLQESFNLETAASGATIKRTINLLQRRHQPEMRTANPFRSKSNMDIHRTRFDSPSAKVSTQQHPTQTARQITSGPFEVSIFSCRSNRRPVKKFNSTGACRSSMHRDFAPQSRRAV